MAQDENRIQGLDFLRFVAITIVIACHFSVSYEPSFENQVLKVAIDGRLGVGIFFVLSGFLITRLLENEKLKTGSISLAGFYKRRILKIFPPLFVMCFTAYIVQRIIGGPCSATDFLSSVTLFKGFYKTPSSDWWVSCPQLAHTWSLTVEEAFYILIAPLLAYTPKKRVVVLLTGIIFVSFSIHSVNLFSFYRKVTWLPNVPVLDNILQIAVGAMGSVWLVPKLKQRISFGDFKHLGISLLFVGLSIIFLRSYLQTHLIFGAIVTLLADLMDGIGVLLIVVALAEFAPALIGKFVSLKPFIGIGRLSYSLYIWQQFYILMNYGDGQAYWLRQFPQSIVLLFVTATITYVLIEKPSRKLALRLTRLSNVDSKEKECKVSSAA